ncbi:phospholipid phosphatase [Bacteroidia bacterium]|nr:phospholipid phosphatase [Bacteroidia bacterium]GHT81231.1 phospholipid phosphatase [Bacteroidia bacterium]
MYKFTLTCLLFIVNYQLSVAAYPPLSYKQPNDTLYRFAWSQCAAPAVAIGMTAIQYTPWMKDINRSVQKAAGTLGFRNHSDDYLQYAPAVAGLALDAVGVYGRHHIVDKTIILAMAVIVETALVNGMKYSIGTLRPDGSTRNSFPSGHTATAFMGAEFLRREYGHLSVWYTVGGYTVAAFTGYMRIQNNRHWLSDVVAGAAVGVFSTQIAYWLYPTVRNAVFPHNKTTNYTLMLMPITSPQQMGISITIYH